MYEEVCWRKLVLEMPRTPEQVLLSAPGTFTPFAIEQIKRALEQGADVNHSGPEDDSDDPRCRTTALHIACRDRSDPAIAQFLLDSGADANALNGLGFAPIHIAANDGNYKCVQVLLDAGATIDPAGGCGDGQTPMLLACSEAASPLSLGNHIKCIQLLLERGAEVDKCDFRGRFPMLFAIINGDYELAELLLSYGSDPDRPLDESATLVAGGATPLKAAQERCVPGQGSAKHRLVLHRLLQHSTKETKRPPTEAAEASQDADTAGSCKKKLKKSTD